MFRQMQPPKVVPLVAVFVGLAAVYAALVILAQTVFAGSDLARTLLFSLGSATLGAGVAFLLIELVAAGRTEAKALLIVSTFVGLAAVLVALVLVAQLLFAGDLFAYTLLVTTGAAIFGGGLTFFLVTMVSVAAVSSGQRGST